MPLKVVKDRKNPDGPWYIRGSIRGRRIEESTSTRDKKRAQEFKTRREAELLDEAVHGRSSVATFAHAAAGYLQFGGEGRFLTPILKHIGTMKLAKVDQAVADACAASLYPDAKPSTLSRQVYTPISAVIQYGAERDMCGYRKFKRPKQPKGKTRWLTVDEASRLIDACAPHLKPIVTVLIYTGGRASEVLCLNWNEVNLSACQVVFVDTKNGDTRGVPLHPLAVAALANLPGRTGNVFRRPDGEPYAEKDEEGGQIKTGFLGACKRAGLAWPRLNKDGKQRKDKHGRLLWKTDITPHTCRHTWASWHYAVHRDPRLLMELGGWRQISMVQRYTHVNVSNHAPSIDALPFVGEIWGQVQPILPKLEQSQGVA